MTDPIILKGRHVTNDRRLDRIPEFDEQSRKFGIRRLLPDKPPRSYSWRSTKVLDQGQEGACVGFAWTQELISRPVVQPLLDDAFAQTIYREAQELDEWPGHDYSGTSVLGGAKAVLARGHMHEYRWAFGFNDLVMALGYAGPVVLGLNWYTGMMDATADGQIMKSGAVEGGHSICAFGVNVPQRRIKLINSWGKDWGDEGRCWISYDDMEALLAEQGEACIPIGRVKV